MSLTPRQLRDRKARALARKHLDHLVARIPFTISFDMDGDHYDVRVNQARRVAAKGGSRHILQLDIRIRENGLPFRRMFPGWAVPQEIRRIRITNPFVEVEDPVGTIERPVFDEDGNQTGTRKLAERPGTAIRQQIRDMVREHRRRAKVAV